MKMKIFFEKKTNEQKNKQLHLSEYFDIKNKDD